MTFLLNGFPVRLVDTAGIVQRSGTACAADPGGDVAGNPGDLERRFASAAIESAAAADLELHVIDASGPGRQPPDGAPGCGGRRGAVLHVFNKCDLLDCDLIGGRGRSEPTAFMPAGGGPEECVFLSALTGEGLADLFSAMDGALGLRYLRSKSEPILFTQRQTELVEQAIAAMRSGRGCESVRNSIGEYLGPDRGEAGI
jgi:tRNA U34 5-carboxymethylaminomethyl modifying GTPase MnmE/TrmE